METMMSVLRWCIAVRFDWESPFKNQKPCWYFFLTTPAVSVARHDVSTGLPQPFSSKQQKKKMPTFLNLLVLLLELSGRCGASSRRSCGNVTFARSVSMSVFYVSSEAYLGLPKNMKKKHEDGRSTKKKVQCNNAYRKNHWKWLGQPGRNVVPCNTDCWCGEKKVSAMNTQQEPTLRDQKPCSPSWK